MENPSQSNQAQLCRNGCGFYGNSKTDGMCSICYKDTLQKKNISGTTSPGLTHRNPIESTNKCSSERNVQSDGPSTITLDTTRVSTSNPTIIKSPSSPTLPTTAPVAIPSASNPNTSLTSPSTQNHSHSMDELSTSLDSSSSSPSKIKKNRCASCRKRLGLTGFHCRCGKIYCSLHRYSDQHACEFDYRADAQAKIRKENPVVVGEKINKI